MNPTIPNDNINICFVGGVSTGKSTCLNGVFCQKLTECKMYKDTSAYHDKIMLIYILDPPWSEQYKRRYYYRNYLK
jgi:hypothetical protein